MPCKSVNIIDAVIYKKNIKLLTRENNYIPEDL